MVEKAIYTLLSTTNTITEIVGSRITPLAGTQGEQRPFLTYTLSSVEPIMTFSGPAKYSYANVEIGAIADSYKECVTLTAAIKATLHGYVGNIGGYRIAPAKLDDESDVMQAVEPGSNKPVYVRQQNYKLMFKPE